MPAATAATRESPMIAGTTPPEPGRGNSVSPKSTTRIAAAAQITTPYATAGHTASGNPCSTRVVSIVALLAGVVVVECFQEGLLRAIDPRSVARREQVHVEAAVAGD